MVGIGKTGSNNNRLRRAVAACAGILVGGILTSAMAQSAPPAAQPPPASESVAAPPTTPSSSQAFRPGFIDAFGRWLGHSKAKIDSHLKETRDTIGDLGTQANDAMKDAAGVVKDAAGAATEATGAIVSLPASRIVTGRQPCPLAENGAPDCSPAAAELCKGKGFAGGRGLDINSSHKCPAYIWLSGRAPKETECKTETYVTRAACQ